MTEGPKTMGQVQKGATRLPWDKEETQHYLTREFPLSIVSDRLQSSEWENP